MFKNYIIFIILLNLINNCLAQNFETINPIIITGNIIPKHLKETGSSVTVISLKEIENKNAHYLSQILTGTPGFQNYTNGGPQTLSRSFLRGNETDHTLVLINGIKIFTI